MGVRIGVYVFIWNGTIAVELLRNAGRFSLQSQRVVSVIVVEVGCVMRITVRRLNSLRKLLRVTCDGQRVNRDVCNGSLCCLSMGCLVIDTNSLYGTHLCVSYIHKILPNEYKIHSPDRASLGDNTRAPAALSGLNHIAIWID